MISEIDLKHNRDHLLKTWHAQRRKALATLNKKPGMQKLKDELIQEIGQLRTEIMLRRERAINNSK